VIRTTWLFVSGLVAGAMMTAAAQEPAPEVVFRSDVSLVRVDVQVLDRNNRAVTGLHREDFILREQGQQREIRNFLAEEMPVDIILLLDVSGSMRPHVQRIADAASSALQVLGRDDRVAIMVFDRNTKLRMPFKNSLEAVEQELSMLLQNERFDGGTDINRGIYGAIRYMQTAARKDARRAIVILTDDQTEFDRDEAGVAQALARADTVLSLLLAPDAMGHRGMGRSPGRTGGGGGVMWPSGGTLPDVIFGRRYPRTGGGIPGGGGNGPVIRAGRTKSAGTVEIARLSGGDSMNVDDAGALETTLSRLRQRYALHFLLPDGASAGQQRSVEVALAGAAQRRYPDAELRYRRTYIAADSGSTPLPADVEPTVSSTSPADVSPQPEVDSGDGPRLRRRPVNERSGASGPMLSGRDEGPSFPQSPTASGPGWRRADAAAAPPPAADSQPARQIPAPAQTSPEPEPSKDAAKQSADEGASSKQTSSGGWRKLKPGEKP
jgi:VWFA-related protein